VKILVTCKRVPNPEQKLKIAGGGIDLATASWQLNTFDEYAVETALRLTEKGKGGERSGEVVAVSIGPKDVSQQLRGVLAMGADRAILVGADDAALDALVVARVLAAIVGREKPDLVVLGKQTVDGDSNQVGQILAGLLGWPQATFVAGIRVAAIRGAALPAMAWAAAWPGARRVARRGAYGLSWHWQIPVQVIQTTGRLCTGGTSAPASAT